MQDYPKTLPPTARVGFTVMDTWLAYAPVKNNLEDAAKVPNGKPYHSATYGEMAIYQANNLMRKKAGVKVDDPVFQVFDGQEMEAWPRVTCGHSLLLTLEAKWVEAAPFLRNLLRSLMTVTSFLRISLWMGLSSSTQLKMQRYVVTK